MVAGAAAPSAASGVGGCAAVEAPAPPSAPASTSTLGGTSWPSSADAGRADTSPQIHDIQDLLVDNQRFAATNVVLQQQLISTQHKLRAVSLASNKARAEREDDVGATADQTARIEAEACTVAGARVEVEQVHADMRALAAARTELMDRLRVLRKQLGRTKSESAKADNVRSQGDPEGQNFEDQPAHWTHPFYIIPNSKCQSLLYV